MTLHEIPPNGQGIAGLMGLGMLDHTAIRDLDADDPRALHLQIEAMKLALKDTESYVADIDHMQRVTPEAMLDPGYLAERAALIDPDRAPVILAARHHGSEEVGRSRVVAALALDHLEHDPRDPTLVAGNMVVQVLDRAFDTFLIVPIL